VTVVSAAIDAGMHANASTAATPAPPNHGKEEREGADIFILAPIVNGIRIFPA
jgi:hypothetical protein